MSRLDGASNRNYSTNQALRTVLNKKIVISPAQAGGDRHYLHKRDETTVHFGNVDQNLGNQETWMMVPTAYGSVYVLQLSTKYGTTPEGLTFRAATNDKKSLSANIPYADLTMKEEFWVQRSTSTTPSYHLINRKYCTALSQPGTATANQLANTVTSVSRGITESFYFAGNSYSASVFSNYLAYTTPGKNISTADLFDRCIWKETWNESRSILNPTDLISIRNYCK